MHHTGIKTGYGYSKADFTADFNCTIQELKQRDSNNVLLPLYDFNCTIQELKHTGHKLIATSPVDFNCTIQELKHQLSASTLHLANDFNCTIQELKLRSISEPMPGSDISIAPYRN